ncbi:iron ABC transporter permease [Actinomycetospora straminea]|uniref:Iron ABC transporter permease n=1 Tax=Actinomycetospora straminea TaxID=663607 RepID=A0ABP9E8B5_9PSEU
MTVVGRRARVGDPLRVAVASAAALLALLPVGYIAVSAVLLGPRGIVDLVWRPRVGELLVNTTVLLVATATACAVLGTATAWVTERTDLPGAPVWGALFAAPLAVPAFVTSYAWVSVLPGVDGFVGALVVTTMSYFPLVHLPVAAVLRGLDRDQEDVARALGLSAGAAAVRVVLPAMRPAIVGGALLVGLHLLAEYGALALLRYPTVTVAIYDLFESTFAGPGAIVLAGVLVVLCLVLLAVDVALVGRARRARVGSGAARRRARTPLGAARVPALLGVGLLVVAALGVPLASLVRWLLEGRSTTLEAGPLLTATVTSIGLGLLAAAVTTALTFPVAWLAVRRPGRLPRLLERTAYLGNALPGIVVALALIIVAIRLVPGLYQTTPLLITAYAILFMPLALVNLRAALVRLPPELEDVAHGLGSPPAAVLVRVTAPLLARGAGAAAALVFLAVSTELTATLLLAPTGTTTLATAFWGKATALAYGAAAPYAATMVLISVPAAFLLTRHVHAGVRT